MDSSRPIGIDYQEREIARLRVTSELASTLLEGDSHDLHLTGWHQQRSLAKVRPLTATQRARLAAMVLEAGRR